MQESPKLRRYTVDTLWELIVLVGTQYILIFFFQVKKRSLILMAVKNIKYQFLPNKIIYSVELSLLLRMIIFGIFRSLRPRWMDRENKTKNLGSRKFGFFPIEALWGKWS
jgi:hypothetical protein